MQGLETALRHIRAILQLYKETGTQVNPTKSCLVQPSGGSVSIGVWLKGSLCLA